MNTIRRQIVAQSISVMGSFAVSPILWAQSQLVNPSQVVQSHLRLVCVGGALTEIIFQLKANRYLVGVDTTSNYPEAVNQITNVGYARTLSAEGILALSPTQILVTEEAGPPMVINQIRAAGIPLNILKSNYQFEGVIDRIQKIGHLINHVEVANQLIKSIEADWKKSQLEVVTRKEKSLSVLFILSHNPSQLMVSGISTSAAAMISYAGAHNAMRSFKGFKPLTPESVIAANPDVILMTDHGIKAVGGMSGVLNFPGVGQTTAGKKMRIISLDTMMLLGFGPRLPQAVSLLNRQLQQVII